MADMPNSGQMVFAFRKFLPVKETDRRVFESNNISGKPNSCKRLAHAGNSLKFGVEVINVAMDDSRYWRIISEKPDEARTMPKEFFAVC